MKDNQAWPWQFAIAEKGHFEWEYREEDLVTWWLQQAEKMVALQTTDGERLIILDPGDRNDGAGPDILRSRMIMDDLELSGAVEMHTHAKDWFAHGHQEDSAYEKVILHVVANAHAGPDLPTLEVQRSWVNTGGCSANRSLDRASLKVIAHERFLAKRNHMRKLALGGRGYDPLLMGMVEIVHAGSQRHHGLHRSALRMGLMHWPDNKRWTGSNQSYPHIINKDLLLENILANADLFEEERWQDIEAGSWSDWSTRLMDLNSLGFSNKQLREWVVNVLAASGNIDWGWELWEFMPVFRHYGMEKRLIPRLGLGRIRKIWEQQGLLAWDKKYCKTHHCSDCPLTHPHNTFRQFN